MLIISLMQYAFNVSFLVGDWTCSIWLADAKIEVDAHHAPQLRELTFTIEKALESDSFLSLPSYWGNWESGRRHFGFILPIFFTIVIIDLFLAAVFLLVLRLNRTPAGSSVITGKN